MAGRGLAGDVHLIEFAGFSRILPNERTSARPVAEKKGSYVKSAGCTWFVVLSCTVDFSWDSSISNLVCM